MNLSRGACTIWKGIAIILVVLGHLNAIPYGGAIGVAIFLFLSGYGLHCSYESKGLDDFWKNKIIGIWIPYFFWTVVLLVAQCITMGGEMKYKFDYKLVAVLLGISPYSPIDGTMWYIPYILLCYCIFWICYKSCGNAIIRNGVMFFIFSAVGILSMYGLFPKWSGAWLYFLCFPLGIYFATFINTYYKKCENLVLISSILLVILYFLIPFSYLFYFVFLYVFCMLLPYYIVKIKINNQILAVIGKYSYWIYLSEGIVIKIFKTYIKRKSEIQQIVTTILEVAIVICIGVLLGIVYAKLRNKMKRLLRKS